MGNRLHLVRTLSWQIKAFRRFQIPDELQEKCHYPTLTKELKAKVFGLNAAKLFKVHIEEKRQDVPKDYLSYIKMAYLEEGPTPSLRVWMGECLTDMN